MPALRAKRILAVLLALCVLVVSGVASAGSITHDSAHAHHQKATHGTVLCAWMCAAGQVHAGTGAPALIEQAPVALSLYAAYLFIPHITLDSVASRGPPHPSTI
jgi:DMSO/TMAO reductase YedYZ heme-binding membrane subunit